MEPAGAPPAFDYNKNGFPEILAGYALRDEWDDILPFVVDWTGNRYQMRAMTRHAPVLPSGDPSSLLVKDRRIWYDTSIRLPNATHGSSSIVALDGYQVGAFAFVSSPQVRVLTGYLAGLPDRQATQLYEMRSNQVALTNFQLEPCYYGDTACEAPSDEQEVRVPSDKLPDDSLLAGWGLAKKLWIPKVTVTHEAQSDCPGCDSGSG